MTELAPIAVFAYRRPEHLKKTLSALSKCRLAEKSVVYLFCDGPKEGESREPIERVRDLARAQKWPLEVHVVASETNRGLSKSVIEGVTLLCSRYGRAIVVEDDLVVAPNFLEYMNAALERYRDCENVMQVSGYMFPVVTRGIRDAFFICHAPTWGWATWQRAWKELRLEVTDFHKLESDRLFRSKFDMNGSYPYFAMLADRLKGGNDSWGILWYLSVFRKGGLTLMPRQTLVVNIGRDGSGTHVGSTVFEDQLEPFEVKSFPEPLLDGEAFEVLTGFLREKHVRWYRRVLQRLDLFFSAGQ